MLMNTAISTGVGRIFSRRSNSAFSRGRLIKSIFFRDVLRLKLTSTRFCKKDNDYMIERKKSTPLLLWNEMKKQLNMLWEMNA